MKINPLKSLSRIALAAAVSAVMCSTGSRASAQTLLAGWTISSTLANGGGTTPLPPTTSAANLLVGALTKGPGIGAVTTGGAFGGNTWTNAGLADSEANSIASGLYLTYTVQALPGYTVSFSTNIVYAHYSGTGPWEGELQYSSDGVNFTDISALVYGPRGTSTTAFQTNLLAGLAALQNVPATITNYFRLVNWGATGTAGTWYIYDSAPGGVPGFQVIGAANPVPPPQNLATWWVNGITTQAGGVPPAPFVNNAAAANVIVTPMTKGAGIGTPTGTANEEYGGNTWTNAGLADSEANSIANGLYIAYAIQAAPGYTVSFFTNVFYYHVSGTGPNKGVLQYSTDGVNYSDLLPMTYGGGGGGSAASALFTNNLSAFPALQNVPATITNFFRIVNWGATGTAGTWYIYDNPPAGSPAGTNDFAVIGGLNSLIGVVAPTNLVVSPAAITANAGTTVAFSASQTGSPATNFWYQITGAATNLIPWATSPTLTLTNVLGANSGSYFVILTNAAGSATSAVVSLTVIEPIIQVQPNSAQGLVDGMVQFAITVAGTAPISYQWYVSDASGDLLSAVNNGTQADNSVVSGATTSLLTITNLQTTTVLNNYVVVASNAYGTVNSSVASLLSVTNTQGMLAFWDFDGLPFTNTAVNPNCLNNPAPFIGVGTAAPVGTCYDPGTSPFSGATDPSDVAGVFTPYGFVQPAPNFSWGTENYPVTGTNKANGVQFNVSTVGAKNINITYDSRVSATASDYERLQYTTNGTTWIDYPASSTFDALYGSGNAGYYTFSYNLTGFPGVANNPNFGIRVVTEYESTATYGIGTTNTWVGTDNTYSSGASGNSAAGTVTYDLVAITGDAITNNNVPPTLGSFMNTNTVDTNTLTLNFMAAGGTTPPDQLVYNAVSLAQIAAEPSLNPVTVNPAFTFGGTGTNRTLTISFAGNPIPDANDAGPILVTATDASGDSAASWFVLTVGSINQPPTNSLTSLQTTNLLANSVLTIPFIAGSARNPVSSLTYSVASDNNTVIPAGNVVVGGNLNTGSLTLSVTPAANQIGNAKISVTVNDSDPVDGGQEPRYTTANIEVMVRPNTNVVLVDDFNYDASGSLDTVAGGFWNHLSGVAGKLLVYPGYALVDTADNTENLQAQLLGSPYRTNSGAVLYASFTVNMSAAQMPIANGSYFAVFNDGSGVTGDVECHVVAATNGAAPGNYRIGINNVNGATALNSVMYPQDLTPGSNYLVVVSLVVSNGFSTLWLNPTNQSAPSVADTTPAANSTNLFNISDFELRESGNSSGAISVGSLLVGLAFDSVCYPPQANPSAFAILENTAGWLSPLPNDAGSDLSLVSVSPDTNGTATISGTNIDFMPAAGFTGTAIVGYTIMDDLGETNSSTLTVTVTNNPPLVNPVGYTVLENSVNNVFNPLTNDVVETPGGTLALVGVSPDSNGTAMISGTSIDFTPAANFTGTATLGYTVTDGIGGTNSSTITVQVVNLTPVPVNALLSGGNLVLTWSNPAFGLQYSTNVAGPYLPVPGATSPYTHLIGTNAAGFFRLAH